MEHKIEFKCPYIIIYYGIYFNHRRRRGPRSRSRSRSSTPDRPSSHSPSTTPPTNELDDRNRRKRLHGDVGMGGTEGKPPVKRQRCKDYDGMFSTCTHVC